VNTIVKTGTFEIRYLSNNKETTHGFDLEWNCYSPATTSATNASKSFEKMTAKIEKKNL